MIDDDDVRQFIEYGYLRIEGAFSRRTAQQCLDIMWPDTGCDPDDPATWTRPVVRLPGYGGGPFEAAAGAPVLHEAFDRLVGPGRWHPRTGLGTIPVRFPHPDDPGDTGWHVEGSYLPEGAATYRTNVLSRGRALLMLFLFTDTGENDAPTRIRIGSHLDASAVLEPAGEEGVDAFELGPRVDPVTRHRPETLATGRAGDVYLCHPFLVHAAQPHRGTRPRFMAQPPLLPAAPVCLDRPDRAYSPVETAIRAGLGC